jgi:protein transport protein SEC20
MSFEKISERLRTLQESNSQLKDLIDRLAAIRFQPGSLPLDNDENNVKTELTSEIHQTIKDQEEDLEILHADVSDLEAGPRGSELEQEKLGLERGVKRAIQELKGCASYSHHFPYDI